MIKIYFDPPECADHLANLAPQQKSHNLDESFQQAIFHLPYPLSADSDFRQKLNKVTKTCEHVIVLVSELHKETVEFIRQHQHPKLRYYTCGFIKDLNTSRWMDWLHRSSIFYKENPQILDKLNPYMNKPKMFDVLLGRNKPHRSFVNDFIAKNNYHDQVIMTYLKGNDNIPLQSQDQSGWIWEPDIVQLTKSFQWTVTSVRYHERSMSLSQVIPISIYNQTAYSIVCETNFDNHYSFYTEKIVKPILAQRLFIVFSGQYYLQNLRRLGFKTFGAIIDEEYDTIADNDLRFNLACEQIRYLLSQPQDEILARIRPITEHNKQVMLDTDWHGDFVRELQALLLA